MSVDHFFGSRFLTTKKSHECIGCCRDFPAGTKMKTSSQKWDGQMMRFYTCATCDSLFTEFKDMFYDEDGYFPGGIVQEYSYEPEFKDRTPEEILEILRLKSVIPA